MSNIDAMFESAFFRACDFDGGKTFVGKIKSVKSGELQLAGQSKKKRAPVVEFENSEKKLALNKTNTATIKEQAGKDSGTWAGWSITLYQINDARFGKKIVDGLRIKNVKSPDGKRSQKTNTGAAATDKDLEYALAGISGSSTEDELGDFLASIRKKQWSKSQGESISAAKEMKLQTLTKTETETIKTESKLP